MTHEAREPVGDLDDGPGAVRVFADWLERVERGETADFEGLLATHPGLAGELRELHATWKEIGEAADSASIPEDPGAGSAFAAARLQALAARSGSFGRYAVEREIARGGMGAILRVWDGDLRRHLAMKVVLEGGETSSVRPKALARFLEEAQVTAQLDHPGVVPVHELGLDAQDRAYFTMKLVEGRDLRRIFALVFEGLEGWNETRALSVLLKVCDAVAYAHSKGVIHRDLKPANVMVGSFGEVFVMDWGLARVLSREGDRDAPEGDADAREGDVDAREGDADARERRAAPAPVQSDRREAIESSPESSLPTIEGDVVGTPAYMPPEQARGEIEALSPRSDVYSIGAMLYHLLAREMPYAAGDLRLPHEEVLSRVLAGPPRPIHERNPPVPAELAAICEKAMAREPRGRYSDVRSLAEDLRAYLEHRVVGAYETGALAELRKWVQRNRALALAVSAGILVLVLGLVVSSSLFVKARTNEIVATQRTNDVLSLSAIQELKELVARADALWPATPERIPDFDRWLSDAKLLVEGRPGDAARGVEPRPGLADHEAKLAELRARAKPLDAREIEADRQRSEDYPKWESARAKLLWMRRMAGLEPWPDVSEVEAELVREKLPTSALGLDRLAWALVSFDFPATVVYGSEVKGLLLARTAASLTKDPEQPGVRRTLSVALYRCGRLDEALDEGRREVEQGKPERTEEAKRSLAILEKAVARWRDAERPDRDAEMRELAASVAELEASVGRRSTFEFEDTKDRWWHDQLAQLVRDLRAFTDAESGLDSAGISAAHGWGIARRRDAAARVEETTRTGPEAKRRWAEAIASIRDRAQCPRYGGLEIRPQHGLLPIGRDPASGLWEFAHLETGEAPERGAQGKLETKDDTGLVFVLIPGGTFQMGAQKTDPTGAHYDPEANPDEVPVHAVTLAPFFLSKFAMTQGQWSRFAGSNPSLYGPGVVVGNRVSSLSHPVEQVTWIDCEETLRRLDLDLPTEAQWEYAARAGTDTVFWTGDDKETIVGAANLSDGYARKNGGPDGWIYEEWLDDGYSVHAPAGTFRPNAFGLPEMIGDVWEWCRDGFGTYELPAREGDGERTLAEPPTHRVYRGGSFAAGAWFARSANRGSGTPDDRDCTIGVRPARALRP